MFFFLVFTNVQKHYFAVQKCSIYFSIKVLVVNPLNAKTIYICSCVPVSQREDHIYMSRAASVRYIA